MRDLVVVGGGAAGTAAARAAAELGLDIVLIEPMRRSARQLAMGVLAEDLVARPIAAAEATRRDAAFVQALRHAGEAAAGVRDRRDRRLDRLGVARLVGEVRVDALAAESPAGPVEIEVDVGAGEVEHLRGAAVLLATGGTPVAPVDCELGPRALADPRELLDRSRAPRSAVVVGGGRGGVELAGLLATAGTEVTLLETRDRLVPDADEDISRALERALRDQGVIVRTGRSARAIERGAEGVTVRHEAAGGGDEETARAELAHAATGRAPEGEPQAAPSRDPAARLRTRAPWLWRAGGAAGGSCSPERAAREGRAAVRLLAGRPEALTLDAAPVLVRGLGGCGWSGMTEREARARGLSLLVGRAALPGRAPVPAGFVKVVAARGSHRVLGIHVAGPRAAELVGVGAVLVEAGTSLLDVRAHAFPAGSASEALVEAAATAVAE